MFNFYSKLEVYIYLVLDLDHLKSNESHRDTLYYHNNFTAEKTELKAGNWLQCLQKERGYKNYN
jgi:hypothetical protein